MAKLPSLNARQVIKALKRAGFVEDRQSGSHLVMLQPLTRVRTVIPVHKGRSISDSLLRAIIREANLSVEEFLQLT